MTRPDRIGKKTVQALVTVEKWKKLRHIITETQRTTDSLITEAIDDLADKYPATPPSGTGCQECEASGGWWLHLRRCAQCGHIGCCDTSPSQHTTAHFKARRACRWNSANTAARAGSA